jgi:hypothetical protein
MYSSSLSRGVTALTRFVSHAAAVSAAVVGGNNVEARSDHHAPPSSAVGNQFTFGLDGGGDDSVVIVNPSSSSSLASSSRDQNSFFDHEIDDSIDTLRLQRSDILDAVLPPAFSELAPHEQDRALGAIIQGVRNVLADPLMVADIRNRARAGGNDLVASFTSTLSSVSDGAIHAASAASAAGAASHWAGIVADHPCLICCDLLSAPVITVGCSHSFCGACIHAYVSAVESDAEVAFCCPACRQPMDPAKEIVFERHLDSVLERLVDGAPACEAKTEWRRRQRGYKQVLAKKQRAAAGSGSNSSSSGGGGGGGNGGYLDDSLLSWLIDLAVPIVAVIVVFLIGLARSRR